MSKGVKDPYNPLNWNWAEIGKRGRANFWGSLGNLTGDFARKHPKFLDFDNPARRAYDAIQAKALDSSEDVDNLNQDE